MTWVDLGVFGLLLLSGLLAFVRGFVREVLGLAAWAGALAAGMLGLPYSRPIVANWISAPAWVDPVAFFGTFLISLIILMLVARLFGGLVRGSVLGGVDRTLGLLFGLARGAAIVVLAYILGAMIFPMDRWPPVVLEARSLWPAYVGAVWVRSQLPEEYRPRIYPPPTIKEATADDLMRATPQGRATDKASVRN
jgi:membrane protein required for colicin V production